VALRHAIQNARGIGSVVASRGAEVMSVPLDVTDSDSTQRAVERVMRELGGLHILVNAAGTIVRGSILEATARTSTR